MLVLGQCENNDLDSTANEIIRDLIKVGMVMNDAEKTAFKLNVCCK